MAAHNIRIVLSDEEEKFIKYLAKHDNFTVNQELLCLLELQVREELELYSQGEAEKEWE